MADFESIVRRSAGDEVPATAINAIVTAIRTAVGNEFVEKERYKAKLQEIDTLKEQTQTAEDNATTAEKWKDKYDKLKSEFDNYKQEQVKQAEHHEKEAAYKELLRDAGIPERHMSKILKYSDVDSVELDEHGKIKTAKELLKEIKEEWSDHIEQRNTQGAQTATPPANSGGTVKSREEIYARDESGRFKLNASERQKALEQIITNGG